MGYKGVGVFGVYGWGVGGEILGYRGVGYLGHRGWGYWGIEVQYVPADPLVRFAKNVKKCQQKNYQNGLRVYPEILPHQKRSILSYPEPPNCHIGKKSKKIADFLRFWGALFFLFPPHQCVGIAIQYAHASRIEDRGENVKKCRKKKFSEWVAEVSRITPTSNTINSELSRASHLPYRQFFFLLFPNISPISWCGIAPPGPLTQVVHPC